MGNFDLGKITAAGNQTPAAELKRWCFYFVIRNVGGMEFIDPFTSYIYHLFCSLYRSL